jgi:hypothetical protein
MLARSRDHTASKGGGTNFVEESRRKIHQQMRSIDGVHIFKAAWFHVYCTTVVRFLPRKQPGSKKGNSISNI